MAEAKICGLTDRAGVDAALAGRARFLGFVAFLAASPRNLGLEAAAALAAPARGRAEIVVLTVNASDAQLDAIANIVKPDWIQLHGSEPPSRIAAVRRYAGKGVIRAAGVASAADLDAAAALEPLADMLLLDAKAPKGADLPGGNGLAFDWKILKGRAPRRPWLLAGGLTPANVSQAIAVSGAPIVDVSTGVESGPGVKEPALITAFLAAASGVRPALPV
ncbi:MAG: phosphoribosylanthranilate isomerase [Hyphomonadaceae bacterium]